MASLTVTIQETGTALQGSQSISESKTLTIDGITSYYHFKGQMKGAGENRPIYASGVRPSGMGGDKDKLAYLRISNLEAAQPFDIIVHGTSGDIAHIHLLPNESFVWCPDIGNANSDQFYHRTSGSTVDASGWITKIYPFLEFFTGKYFEVFGAFID